MDKYTISAHAKQRYAERIMGREDSGEINRFINANEEKIKTDIIKMITYGKLIFSGNQMKNDKKATAITDVYSKDCWVVFVDNKTKNVITLYKIDLGAGDDFNQMYIDKMIAKLEDAKAAHEAMNKQIEEENLGFLEVIEESELSIKQYRSMINNLEKLIEGYKIVVANNNVKTAEAYTSVTNILNTMVGKKTF